VACAYAYALALDAVARSVDEHVWLVLPSAVSVIDAIGSLLTLARMHGDDAGTRLPASLRVMRSDELRSALATTTSADSSLARVHVVIDAFAELAAGIDAWQPATLDALVTSRARSVTLLGMPSPALAPGTLSRTIAWLVDMPE
jgi:hypothetical protein